MKINNNEVARKHTNVWKLSNTLLYNPKEEIKTEIKTEIKYFELTDKNTIYKNLWNGVKVGNFWL